MSDSTIERLTSSQRAHLRKIGHQLDPIVRIGKDGLSSGVMDAIEEAFNTHELIKVRTSGDPREDAEQIAEELTDRIGPTHVVQTIGGVMVLYRPFPKNPVIELP